MAHQSLNPSARGAIGTKPPLGFSIVDVGSQAGLGEAVNVYGGVRTKRYLIDEMGCGVAFFDYDNDGLQATPVAFSSCAASGWRADRSKNHGSKMHRET